MWHVNSGHGCFRYGMRSADDCHESFTTVRGYTSEAFLPSSLRNKFRLDSASLIANSSACDAPRCWWEASVDMKERRNWSLRLKILASALRIFSFNLEWSVSTRAAWYNLCHSGYVSSGVEPSLAGIELTFGTCDVPFGVFLPD